MKSELDSFDGRDNRREIMILLGKLGSDSNRAKFLESLIPSSLKGFANCPMKVTGKCDTGIAYFMLVSICNELGCSINQVASKLDKVVKRGIKPEPNYLADPLVRAICDTSFGGE